MNHSASSWAPLTGWFWVAARQAEGIAELARRAAVEHDEGIAGEVVAAFRPEPVRLLAEELRSSWEFPKRPQVTGWHSPLL